MPKLPDVSDLGYSTPQPSYNVASYNAGQVGAAIERLGNTVSDTSDKLKERQDQFDLERARSYILTKQVETQQALKDDPDFTTYEARYKKAMGQAAQDASALISNPNHQQLFQIETQADLTRGLSDVQDMARAKSKDYGRATLDDQLEANRKASLTADPATANKLLQSSNGLISSAYDRGYVSAEEGVKTRQSYVQSYAEDWLKMQPLQNQLALLTKPVQGPPIPADMNSASGPAGVKLLPVNAKEAGSEEQAAKNAVINSERLKGNPDGTVTLGPEQPAPPGNLGSGTRGLRNNNPGNLMGTDPWQGMTGTDDKGFAQFSQPSDGLRAMAIDLRNQQDMHGLNTVQDIISKYAPASKNDTPSYIAAVSQEMGVKPTAPLDLHDPKTVKSMMAAMIRHENGAQPYSPASLSWAATSATLPDTAGPPPPDQVHAPTMNALTAAKTGTPVDFLPADKKAEWIAKLPELIKAQKEQQQSAILDQAMPIIEKNNGDWTAIPADLRQKAMQAGIWNKIIEYKGVSNEDLKVNLLSMSPDKLAQMDFNDPEIKSRLSSEDRAYFAKQAQDYRDKPAEASLQQSRHDMVQGAFERLFPGDEMKNHAPQIATFQSLLDSEIAAYKIRNKKNPDNSDIQGMVDGLLMNKVKTQMRGWLTNEPVSLFGHAFTNEQYAFDVKVPDDERDKIITALQNKQQPVTEGNILRYYLLAKGQPVGR